MVEGIARTTRPRPDEIGWENSRRKILSWEHLAYGRREGGKGASRIPRDEFFLVSAPLPAFPSPSRRYHPPGPSERTAGLTIEPRLVDHCPGFPLRLAVSRSSLRDVSSTCRPLEIYWRNNAARRSGGLFIARDRVHRAPNRSLFRAHQTSLLISNKKEMSLRFAGNARRIDFDNECLPDLVYLSCFSL